MKDLAIGVDVGGTKIAAGVIDRDANILSEHIIRCYGGDSPEAVVGVIQDIVRIVLLESGRDTGDIAGVGVGSAGHIDFERGIVLANSNLPGWRQYPLRDVLRRQLGVPVILDNDANCAALAEHRIGAGKGARHMAYITFSTGCGMGILIEGRLYRGGTGTAGEIGHIVVDPDGPQCSCGKRGCLMSYACGMSLSRMALERIAAGEPSLLGERIQPGSPCPAEAIAEAAQQGDPMALDLLSTAGRFFGIGLATVVELLNPQRIVIGGGLAHIGPLLMDPCIQALNENIDPVLMGTSQLVLSELWDRAGMLGAGMLVWEPCL